MDAGGAAVEVGPGRERWERGCSRRVVAAAIRQSLPSRAQGGVGIAHRAARVRYEAVTGHRPREGGQGRRGALAPPGGGIGTVLVLEFRPPPSSSGERRWRTASNAVSVATHRGRDRRLERISWARSDTNLASGASCVAFVGASAMTARRSPSVGPDAALFPFFLLLGMFRVHRGILMGICPVKRARTSASCFVRGDIYVATTSSSFPSTRSEWEC